MKALLSTATGGPETLTLGELPRPTAGKGQIVIDVKACAVNFPDTLIIEDKYQFRPERPFAPGGEVAGVVAEVGEGVTQFKVGDRVIAAISAEYPGVRKDGNDTVSGKVAGEFRTAALYALLAAMAAIAIYIWVRFEWQFGVGALFALVHDVSLTMGFFAITQLEFSLQIIAAILAIIGYSLNDTIVVYDRIRENLKKFRKMPLPELLDLSVNETLARTIMTSLTLLIALIPLLLFGPASLFGMVAAITLGIFVGTYSSIYMAAPILIWLGVTSTSFVPQEGKADQQDKIARGEA